MKEEVGDMVAEEGHRVRDNVYWNLVVAPVVGLLYVIALPFIAIGTVLALIGKKAVGGLAAAAGNLLSFGWRPSEAHLAGKKKEQKKRDEESPSK